MCCRLQSLLTFSIVLALAFACSGGGGEADPGRVNELQTIGTVGSATPEQREMLMESLDDRSAEIRSTAAWVLGEIGDTESVPRLKEMAADDGDPFVRMNAAAALKSLGGAGAAQPSLVALLDEEDPTIVQAALSHLSDPMFVGAADEVGRVFSEGPEEVRGQALDALVAMGPDAAVKHLEQAAADPDENVRSIAAFSLGKLGGDPAVDALIGMLADEHWTVRANATQALAKIGDPRAASAIQPLLEDPNSQVQAVAQQAMDHLGS